MPLRATLNKRCSLAISLAALAHCTTANPAYLGGADDDSSTSAAATRPRADARSDFATRDLAPPDAGARDASRDADVPPLDGAIADAPPADAPQPDAPQPDAPQPDAPQPDLPPPPSCDELYGSAGGYQLCDEQPDRCTFYTDSGFKDSCEAICFWFADRDCLAAWDEKSGGCAPQPGSPDDCTALHADQICVCAR